jgi:hypothetical protein
MQDIGEPYTEKETPHANLVELLEETYVAETPAAINDKQEDIIFPSDLVT